MKAKTSMSFALASTVRWLAAGKYCRQAWAGALRKRSMSGFWSGRMKAAVWRMMGSS